MRQVLENRNFDNADAFVKAINAARLEKRKSWFFYVGKVCGKDVEIKSYDTGYLQILRVDGINHPAGMDMNVGGWKNAILKAVS